MGMFDDIPVLSDQPTKGTGMFDDIPVLSAEPTVSAPAGPGWGGYAADLAKSAGSGLSTGVAGVAGMPATVMQGMRWVKAGGESLLTGQPFEEVKARNNAGYAISPEKLDAATGPALQASYGYEHKPQTTVGQYVKAGAEFMPGALMGPGGVVRDVTRKLAMGGVAGVASEGAGNAAKAGGLGPTGEMVARIAGGVAAPVAAGRLITPIRTNPDRIPHINALEAEGVNLTAGQRTGSRPLRYAESMLGDTPLASNAATLAKEAQAKQFNQAVAKRMGENADLFTPEMMKGARDRIGRQFDDISSRNVLTPDAQLGTDLMSTVQTYGRTLPSQRRETFNNYVTDIMGGFSGGQMAGDVYQRTRSNLTRDAKSVRTTDPQYAEALRGLRQSLDDGFARSVSPADATAWQQANQQYGAMKTVEKAVTGAGEQAALGNISPQQLRSAVAANDRPAYARGQGELAKLSRAGAAAMSPLPDSGTASRQIVTSLLSGGLGSGGGYAGASFGPMAAAAGAAVGMAVPAIAGRGLMLGPVQKYLGNHVMRDVPGGRDAVVRALIGAQGQSDAPAPAPAPKKRAEVPTTNTLASLTERPPAMSREEMIAALQGEAPKVTQTAGFSGRIASPAVKAAASAEASDAEDEKPKRKRRAFKIIRDEKGRIAGFEADDD